MDEICSDCELYNQLNEEYEDMTTEEFIFFVNEQNDPLIDFDLIVKFYSGDYNMSVPEIKKLCYTMSYVGNKYEKEALILAKHYRVFDYLFETEKDCELHSDLYNKYKDLNAEKRLDLTSIACGSFYFAEKDSHLYKTEYSKIACIYDKLEILKTVICLEYDIFYYIQICIDNQSSECFDFLITEEDNYRLIDIENYFYECIKQHKNESAKFLHNKKIYNNDVFYYAIDSPNLEFFCFLIESGEKIYEWDLKHIFEKYSLVKKYPLEQEKLMKMIDITVNMEIFTKDLIFQSSLENNVEKYFHYMDNICIFKYYLMICCHTDNLKMFIKMEKSVNYKHRNSKKYHFNFLLESLKNRSNKITKYLLDSGIKPNYECLKIAFDTKNDEMIEKIISLEHDISYIPYNFLFYDNEILFNYLLNFYVTIRYYDILELFNDSNFRKNPEKIKRLSHLIKISREEKEKLINICKEKYSCLVEFFSELQVIY